MKNHTISTTAKFSWVEILKISPAKLLKYKKEGLPSETNDPLAWEKYILELEGKSESSGSIQYLETTEVSVSSPEALTIERKQLNAENFNFRENPQRLDYEEGKNYLVRIQSSSDVTYSKTIASPYNKEMLTFEVTPECIPGGRIIKTLIGKYDGQFFDYPRDCYQYTESEVYLVDSKGNRFQIQVN